MADTDLAGRVAAIAFTDDGSVVVVGSTPLVASLGSGELVLVRYTPDGRLDTRFAAGGDDGDGQVVVHGLSYTVPELAKIDPEGRIVVTLGGSTVRVLRFNADGTRDMGFGEDGVASATFGHGSGTTSLRILDDGKILVGVRAGGAPAPGSEDYDASVRFNPNGSPDLSYGAPHNFGGIANIFVPREDTGEATGSRRTASTSPTRSRPACPRVRRRRPPRTEPPCRRTGDRRGRPSGTGRGRL